MPKRSLDFANPKSVGFVVGIRMDGDGRLRRKRSIVLGAGHFEVIRKLVRQSMQKECGNVRKNEFGIFVLKHKIIVPNPLFLGVEPLVYLDKTLLSHEIGQEPRGNPVAINLLPRDIASVRAQQFFQFLFVCFLHFKPKI